MSREINEGLNLKFEILRFSLGFLLFIIAVFTEKYSCVFYIFSYFVFGYDVISEAFTNLFHGIVFNENLLMTVASAGAFALGDFKEAVAVMMLYMIGETAQDAAVDYSVSNIENAMNLTSPYALLKVGDSYEKVSAQDVKVGQIVKILPGEKIPVDGRVIYGSCLLDCSSLTGESLPVSVGVGSEVLSGSIVTDSPVEMECTAVFEDSSVSKILDIVSKAKESKSPVENFITRFAKVYTPVVFCIAVAVAVLPSVLVGDWNKWIYRALEFLVISCPCALVISVPLSFFAGIGCCAANGVLIKGANHLEALSNTKYVAFDKTGTLTQGKFSVKECSIEDLENLSILYSLENNSTHPLAKAICVFCKEKGASLFVASALKEIPGMGIEGEIVVDGKVLHAECGRFGVSDGSSDSSVSLFVEGKFTGFVWLEDSLKSDVASALGELKTLGVEKTFLLSGDKKKTVEAVCEKIGIDGCFSELLPVDKVEVVKKLCLDGKTVFVGDGINDAPVLIAADVGVSMGRGGSESAIQASGIVIMKDEISKIPFVLRCSKKTVSIAKLNICIALSVKVLFMILCALGLVSMSWAVFADVGVCLICVANSMRALRF